MQSRMFDLPGKLVLNDLQLYPAEEWRIKLQDYLASGDRDEVDSMIQEIISGQTGS